MVKACRVFFLILFFILPACTTTKSTADTAEEDRQIQTAKINAQLGMAYLQMNNVSRAKQKLLVALNQAPKIPETWYSMAYYYEATGNKVEAEKHYSRAIALAPGRGDAQNNYGTFLCRTGQYKTSIKYFLAAVNDPNYLDTADAYENAALCSLKIPDRKQATLYFNHAIQLDPGRGTSILELAELDYKAGKYSSAKDRLQHFLTVSSQTPHSMNLANRLQERLAPKIVAKNNEINYTVSAKILPMLKITAPQHNVLTLQEKHKEKSSKVKISNKVIKKLINPSNTKIAKISKKISPHLVDKSKKKNLSSLRKHLELSKMRMYTV